MKNEAADCIVKGQSIWFVAVNATQYNTCHTTHALQSSRSSQSYFYARRLLSLSKETRIPKKVLPLIFGVIFVTKTSFFPLFPFVFSKLWISIMRCCCCITDTLGPCMHSIRTFRFNNARTHTEISFFNSPLFYFTFVFVFDTSRWNIYLTHLSAHTHAHTQRW